MSVTVPSGCPAYRIVEMPRLADPHTRDTGPRDGGDPGRAQRVAALAAAYHAGIAGPGDGTVAFGWVRTAAGGPILVIAAGRALVGSAHPGSADAGSADAGSADASGALPGGAEAGAGEVLLALPGGARATALPPGALAGLLDQVGCWREVAGISDGLLVAGEPDAAGGSGGSSRTGRAAGLSLDEGLLGSWTGPFGWLVVAQPVAPAGLRALSEEAGLRQRLAEGAGDRFPERAAQARRLKQRHAELQRGVSTGLWRITIVAGGRDAASAARVAGLFCASADLGGLPYALCPALDPGSALAPANRPGPELGPRPGAAPGTAPGTAPERRQEPRSSRAATPSRPRRSTARASSWPRSRGRPRPRCPGSGWRSAPTST